MKFFKKLEVSVDARDTIHNYFEKIKGVVRKKATGNKKSKISLLLLCKQRAEYAKKIGQVLLTD